MEENKDGKFSVDQNYYKEMKSKTAELPSWKKNGYTFNYANNTNENSNFVK